MTIFGPDISSYQRGLVLSRLADASFVIAKTTEGTYYTDPDYGDWRRQAAALNKPFVWYHFLSAESAQSQVAHTLANVGDKNLPGMLDSEPSGSFSPTLAQILAYTDAAHAAGLNLRLVYLPRWYHQQMGSPDLTGLTRRGVSLVSSAYPGGTGSPTALYPGDSESGWGGYGGVVPQLYQFTNQASDGGQNLDYNAYRGTIAQLQKLLGIAPRPEDNMPAFAMGQINSGRGAVTVVLPPPANSGAAGWGNVWFSLGSDMGDAHVRVAAFVKGAWADFNLDFVVPAAKARVFPLPSPLPADVEKISITRLDGSENVSVGYLVEAAA